MEINSLRLFVQVTENGGFTAAARRLGVDPSLVSRTIAGLEQELGFSLFHRSTRKIALTNAGSAYLQQITPLLEELKLAEESARDQHLNPEGRLTLTASTAFGQTCILPHMAQFQARYPKVQLDLRFTDAVLDILEERIDLACRLTSNADPNLVGRKLFSTYFWVCASPEYLARYGTPEHPAELSQHRTLAFNLPRYRERWLFERGGDSNGQLGNGQLTNEKLSSRELSNNGELIKVPLRPAVIVSNALAMLDLAARGLGIGLLASWLVTDHLKQGTLVRLFPEYRVTATDFESAAWMLYPSRRFLPAKTRAMVEFLREKYQGWE